MSEVLSLVGAAKERPAAQGAAGLLEASLEEARAAAPSAVAFREAHRTHALSVLEASGFPSPKDEAWRFTPLRDLLRVPYCRRSAPTRVEDLVLPSLYDDGGARVVLVNGSPRLGSVPTTVGGLEVHRLRDLLTSAPERLATHLGRIAPLDHGFLAQNAASFDDGLVVVAPPRARGRVHLVHVAAAGTEPTLSTPRVLVMAEKESEVSLVETHLSLPGAPHFENSVTEVSVGEGARVDHVRVHHGARHASAYGAVAVRQQANSSYKSRTFTFGGKLTRVDLYVTFEGTGAECALDGLYLAHGGEVVDHRTVIDHARPRCTSRERYKGIVDDDGLAVFDGTVFVRQGADRTEAHQENRNLLLSNDAVVHTKPHLEIDTDDVKCSHGATVGRLDPAQLFYLRSRGMDAAVARSLLTYAFAREMAAPVSDIALRASLESSIAALLPGGDAVRGLA